MCGKYFTVFLVLLASTRNTRGSTEEELEEYSKYEESFLKAKYPDYGVKWIYMPDGNGVPQRAELIGNETMEIAMRSRYKPVRFLLYTKNNMKEPVLLKLPSVSESSESIDPKIPFGEKMFDPTKNTKFIIHGWSSNGNTTFVNNLKDAFLKHYDYNVIAVDWEDMAGAIYFSSVGHTKRVGRTVANLLNHLLKHHNMKPEQFHLIGHSLGAHTAGFAGLYAKQKLGRITGLDPARPGFEVWAISEDRLDESDAEFVDAIHTCGGVLGYMTPVAHADFYPNGGKPVQPGCLTGLFSACSHSRAYELFTESIHDPQAFPARRCENENEFDTRNCTGDVSHMGNNARSDLHGTFILETNDESPFSTNSSS